jgi:hypothetical protein
MVANTLFPLTVIPPSGGLYPPPVSQARRVFALQGALKTCRPGSENLGAGACPGASRVGTVEGVAFSPAHVCVAVQASAKLTASTQTAFCQFLIVLSFLD